MTSRRNDFVGMDTPDCAESAMLRSNSRLRCAGVALSVVQVSAMRETTFDSPDGLVLHAYLWEPQAPVRGVLQIVHGMAEHARRYARLAEAFARAGWLTLAHDQRGHGQSVDHTHPLGHLADDDGFHRAVEDAHRINRWLAEEYAVPIVVLGHSMGSFHVQQLIYECPKDAIGFALSGTDGSPGLVASLGRGVARLERARLGRRTPSPLLTKLSFGDFNKGFEGRTEYDWLSRDHSEVDAYVGDPLCGFPVSTQTWVDLLDALPRIHRPEAQRRIPSDKPVYLLAGGADPVGQRGEGVERLASAYREAGLREVKVRVYPEARHELLNETNRDEATQDLRRWCDSLLATGSER